MTGSLINYFTTFESTNNLPMQIVLGHGENADLVANFTDNGIPVSLSGYTARAIYQPKSKWGTEEWYECPCDISGDTATAHWGNTYDNGDNAVIMWLHFLKDGKVAYPALYKIRLFETPGFTPSAITPIPETLDFSQYTIVNAPWALSSDLNTLSGTVEDLSDEVASLPYLKGIAPHTSGETITLSASSRHVYQVTPYGNNISILVTFPTPTTQIFDCIIDVDIGDAENDVGITFDDTNFASEVDGSIIMGPGEKARYYITETRFMSNGKPILLIQRKDVEV